MDAILQGRVGDTTEDEKIRTTATEKEKEWVRARAMQRMAEDDIDEGGGGGGGRRRRSGHLIRDDRDDDDDGDGDDNDPIERL